MTPALKTLLLRSSAERKGPSNLSARIIHSEDSEKLILGMEVALHFLVVAAAPSSPPDKLN